MLKDHNANDQELYNRARGLLLLGAIFKSTVPDESDEERRELERYVVVFFFLVCGKWSLIVDATQDGRRGCETEKETGATECRDASRAESRARSASLTCGRGREHDDGRRVFSILDVTTPAPACSCSPHFRLHFLKTRLPISTLYISLTPHPPPSSSSTARLTHSYITFVSI